MLALIWQIFKWILYSLLMVFLYATFRQFRARLHYKSQKRIKVFKCYVPILGDSLKLVPLFSNPSGANAAFKEFAKFTPKNQIGVLIQMPPKDVLFIQDPYFIEKLHEFIPHKIDRTLEKECGG